MTAAVDQGQRDQQPATDMVTQVDMRAVQDMAPTVDMAPAVDMAPTVDMAPAVDMTPAIDMAPVIDMAPAVDMAPAPSCGAALCFSNFDCADGTLCLVDPVDDARSCCQPGERGQDPAGAPCGDDGERTCASAVCIAGDAGGRCSTRCEDEGDCPATMQFCFPIAIDDMRAEAWCFPTE